VILNSILRLSGRTFRAASSDPTGATCAPEQKPARGGLSHVQERRHHGHSSHHARLRQSLGAGCIGSGSLPERARGELRDSKGKPLPRLSGRGFVVAITQHFRRRAHDSAACLRDRYRLLRDASSSSRSGAMRAGAGGLGPASIFFDVNWSTSYGPVLCGLCCADGACGPVQKD
jgi:hypothetical protein